MKLTIIVLFLTFSFLKTAVALDEEVDQAIDSVRNNGDIRDIEILYHVSQKEFLNQSLDDVRMLAREKHWVKRETKQPVDATYEVRTVPARGAFPECKVNISFYTYPNTNRIGAVLPFLIYRFACPYNELCKKIVFRQHSVLDRVLHLNDLRKVAADAPYLQTMEVSYERIFWSSSPIEGYGFEFTMNLDSVDPGKTVKKSVSYRAYSDLDPVAVDGKSIDFGESNGAVVVPVLSCLPETGEVPVFFRGGAEFETSQHH